MVRPARPDRVHAAAVVGVGHLPHLVPAPLGHLEAAAVGLGAACQVELEHIARDQAQPDGSRFKVPQMGWNQVRQVPHAGAVHPVWAGVPDGSYYYFVHSFYALPQNAAHCAGQTDYGGVFAAAIARDNIFATQFHPEKSAEHGLALYRNFLHWNP